MKKLPVSVPDGKEPDYILKGTASSGNFKLHNVLCEIYLSNQLGEVGIASFKPPSSYSLENDEEWPFKFSFHGEVKGVGSWPCTIIHIQKAYHSTSSVNNQHTEVEETIIHADIWEMLTRSIPYDYLGIENDPPVLRHFALSPCFLLDTHRSFDRELTGEVQLRNQPELFSVKLTEELTIKFDTHYEHSTGKHNESIMTPYLIASHKLASSWSDSYNYQDIDNFMHLVSFVTRKRCMCLSTDIEYKHSYTSHKRAVSLGDEDHDNSSGRRDALVYNQFNFRRYVQAAYKSFQQCQHQELLTHVIGSTLGSWAYTTDEFLSLYSALETLILIFRKENQFEFILNKGEFKILKESLEATIKEKLNQAGDKEHRGHFYKNLIGINRAPFPEAFTAFKNHYDINTNDLWPVVNHKGSLSVIRNRLVHGNIFKNEELAALTDATFHLRHLLERFILHYLNCSEHISGTYIPENDELRKRFQQGIDTIKNSHFL